jgi:sodium-dependent dicarboxylate transporter 2/3/5
MAEQAGSPVGFTPFFIVAFVIGYGSVILYLLAMKFIFRPDVSNLTKEYDFSSAEKMTPYQKKILASVFLLIVCFFVQSTFSTSAVGAFLSKFGTSGIVLAFLLVMSFFKKQDGTPFVDIVKGTKEGVAWPVFFCLTVGMTIATALGSADLGIKDQIQLALSPFFGSSNAQFLLLSLAVIVILIMTNFMGNYSCAIIMYTVCVQFADSLGIKPALLACLLGVLANCSIVFPSANPLAAMMHGMKEWLEAKDIYKYACVMVLCCAICAIVVVATFGNAIFG